MSSKLPSIDIFEIRTAKNGLDVPYINGVHLHSIYNPLREAETLAKNNQKLLQEKPTALVLGLGLAYHVHEILHQLEQFHQNYHIMVIDPCVKSYQHCIKRQLIGSPHITVKAGIDIEMLYRDEGVIEFLVGQPSVIAHPASFNLYDSYYKEFLSYRAPKKLTDIADTITNQEMRSWLSEAPGELRLDELVLQIKNSKTPVEKSEAMLLMAFDTLASQGKLESIAHVE